MNYDKYKLIIIFSYFSKYKTHVIYIKKKRLLNSAKTAKTCFIQSYSLNGINKAVRSHRSHDITAIVFYCVELASTSP